MNGMNLFEGLDWVVDDVAKRLYYSSTVAHPQVELKAKSAPKEVATQS